MSYEILLYGELVWNFPLLAILAGILFLYFYILKRYTTVKLYRKPPVLFLLSICLLYFTIGSPLSAFSHLSFSLHMFQMSILYFIIPPLLLAGIPPQFFETIHPNRTIKWIGSIFLPAKFALILFSFLFLIYHLPVAMSLFSQYPIVQNGLLFFLFFLSFNLWWPVLSPIPEQRLYKERKKRYLFLSGILLMPACTIFIAQALIDGAQHPFLHQLSAQLCFPPEAMDLNILPPFFHTKYDQVIAGSLMLGIHKLGMVLSSRLVPDVEEEGQNPLS
ncbi:cytochrome c oxidase assembly protein [Oceanobacillus alkalisoli]|uniref:cytochrome c oxidase assembly protein n=1 Tax=Oceanobacillus alkalisoli TaxID=2925113 RepID=UPI001F122874|nr:cytochrome c oxidase assembly protein [Oceanobacillus alkalisoli]MCF3942667.1 cytochrome c oxidase assembly protein [Oceanobacillus alkalisoli]